jgi:hypothetical protein
MVPTPSPERFKLLFGWAINRGKSPESSLDLSRRVRRYPPGWIVRHATIDRDHGDEVHPMTATLRMHRRRIRLKANNGKSIIDK